jgi:hypothetical protein
MTFCCILILFLSFDDRTVQVGLAVRAVEQKPVLLVANMLHIAPTNIFRQGDRKKNSKIYLNSLFFKVFRMIQYYSV